jgi:hypothetical protein
MLAPPTRENLLGDPELFCNLVHLTAGVLTQFNRVVFEFVAVTATDLFLSHGVSSS